MIISNVRKEEAFFEALEREYMSLPMDQRAAFLTRAKEGFQKTIEDIRDSVHEVEKGQHYEGIYDIHRPKNSRIFRR